MTFLTLLTKTTLPATRLERSGNTRKSCFSGNSSFVRVVAGRERIVKSDQKVSKRVRK